MNTVLFRSYDRFSQEEFARWVETVPAGDLYHYELLDGFIVREPPANWPHGEVGGRILTRLASSDESARLGRVFDSSQGFDLPSGDTVEPDVSFASTERWRAAGRAPKRGFLRVVPDLIFEVLSPGTARIDRIEKRRIYEQNGVREYVLVDSRTRSLQCFRLEGDRFDAGRRFATNEVFTSHAIPGFSVPVRELFPDP